MLFSGDCNWSIDYGCKHFEWPLTILDLPESTDEAIEYVGAQYSDGLTRDYSWLLNLEIWVLWTTEDSYGCSTKEHYFHGAHLDNRGFPKFMWVDFYSAPDKTEENLIKLINGVKWRNPEEIIEHPELPSGCKRVGEFAVDRYSYIKEYYGKDGVFRSLPGLSLDRTTLLKNIENVHTVIIAKDSSIDLDKFCNLETLIYEDGVEGIYSRVKSEKLTKVIIPDSVTHIDNDVFVDCPNLNMSSLDLPERIKNMIRLSDYFYNKEDENAPKMILSDDGKYLKSYRIDDGDDSIVLPSGIIGIEDDALDNDDKNDNIKHIVLPDTLERICYDTLPYFESVKSIEIPSSVKSISGMNLWSSLEEIVFHEGIESIDGFDFCNVKKIAFPSSLKSISGFGYCSLLESVTIPDSVTDIFRAFNNCEELTDVTFGPNIERIDDHSFSNTPFMNKLKKKNVIGKCLYSCDKKAAKITIPDDIVGIKENAFANSSIKEITIPASVKTSDLSFKGCKYLKKIIIPESEKGSIGIRVEKCTSLSYIEIMREAKYFPYIDDCSKDIEIVWPKLDISLGRNADDKMVIVRSYLAHSEKYTEEQATPILDYAWRSRKKVLPYIFEKDNVQYLKLLMEGRKVTKASLKADFCDVAAKSGASKCAEYLAEIN